MSSISKASDVSGAAMVSSPDLAPLTHGGDLGAARRLFPGAPEPFLDLSTGINPNPYPVPQVPLAAFTELPQPEMLERLAEIAAKAYGAPSPAYVAAAPGSQVVMIEVARLLAPGRAAILGPTYAEHARAAALAGHEVIETDDVEQLGDTALAIAVNPNNPDGRIVAKDVLLALADRLRRRGGLLVVDEAFMDSGPEEESLATEVKRGGIVVLRSFGKFYGLPGLRLSFALAAPEIAKRLAAAFGPWPVSGPALAIGSRALADTQWKSAARARLEAAANRLGRHLAEAGLEVIGGTPLFRLARLGAAERLFRKLGERGVLVRRFDHQPDWLRFGLPGSEADWRRLTEALKL
jgi:cobalamin biosynthesis protein CobC